LPDGLHDRADRDKRHGQPRNHPPPPCARSHDQPPSSVKRPCHRQASLSSVQLSSELVTARRAGSLDHRGGSSRLSGLASGLALAVRPGTGERGLIPHTLVFRQCGLGRHNFQSQRPEDLAG
jgi:hypothetical protein